MMKITNKYYFSTEGETEKWYLQHLEKLINNEAASVCNVSFYVKKSNPVSYVKGINVLRKTPVYHVFDVESNQEDDIKSFENMLGCMRKAEGLGRAILYENGYSNLTFELWIISHKYCKLSYIYIRLPLRKPFTKPSIEQNIILSGKNKSSTIKPIK